MTQQDNIPKSIIKLLSSADPDDVALGLHTFKSQLKNFYDNSTFLPNIYNSEAGFRVICIFNECIIWKTVSTVYVLSKDSYGYKHYMIRSTRQISKWKFYDFRTNCAK